MQHEYPHINDTSFPDLESVNAYKYQNEYDYSQYTDSVKIKMMNVSWCSDYENVVYFESKEARDAWFDSKDGLVKELSSMFRLYNDGSIKVDIPIDECMQYNFVMIDYGKLPQQSTATKDSKMFYFITGMNQASVNATELILSVDYWTTYINDMNVQYVNLARGHWPMAQTDVDTYLANPIGNSEYMLSPDVNYSDGFSISAGTDSIIFNNSEQDMYLGFLTNGNATGDQWSGKVDTDTYYKGQQQFSSVMTIAIPVSDWLTFKIATDENCPQFWQTVKGMFVIPFCLLNKLSAITLQWYDSTKHVYRISTNSDCVIGNYQITKSRFGYSGKLAEIPKLYTYPYASLQVQDFKGNVSEIRVEDTSGTLTIHTVMNDMYPFLNIEAYMTGIGSSSTSYISFKTAQDNTMRIGGSYYNFTTKWSIPVFAVQLTTEEDWQLNGNIGATAIKDNTTDTASVDKDNTNAIAQGNRSNTNSLAGAITANASVNNTMIGSMNYNTRLTNNSITTKSIAIASLVTSYNNAYSQAMQAWNAGYSRALQATDAEAATKSAAASIATGALATVADAASTAVTNPLAGAATLLSGVASGANTVAQTAISVDASATKTEAGISNTQSSVNETSTNNTNIVNQQNEMTQWTNDRHNELSEDNTTLQQTAITNIGNNNYNASVNGATAIYNAATSSATRSYELVTGTSSNIGTAQRTFNAARNQVYINNHPQFGQQTGTPDIVNKPFGLSYNIVTQSKNAIRQAGEQFLRYGYYLNMEVDIESFNMMPVFTYWKCDTVYCNDNGVFIGAQDVIKSILNNGVTVWKDPSKIGKTSIYDNIEVS